jgi:hypothetical protein
VYPVKLRTEAEDTVEGRIDFYAILIIIDREPLAKIVRNLQPRSVQNVERQFNVHVSAVVFVKICMYLKSMDKRWRTCRN